MEIYKYGSEILRQKAKDIEKIDQKLVDLLEDMIETMILAPGIGLAAPQVGHNLNMFVMNVKENIYERIINPKILKTSGFSSYNEGCLSFPKLYMDITRPEWIKVAYINENGEEIIQERDGIWARCFQHEFDHLSGKLFVDYFSKKQFKSAKESLINIEELGLLQNLRPPLKLE